MTITLSNDTLTDRFLVLTTIGDDCEPLSINRIANGSSDGVRQDEGFQCGCECPGPGPSGLALLQRIAPGASFDVSWDAREAILCSQSYEECGDGMGATTYGSRKAPVAPGDYEIRLKVLNGAPLDCVATADGYDCGANLQLECTGDQDIVVPFTIDAAGDVTLMASIAS